MNAAARAAAFRAADAMADDWQGACKKCLEELGGANPGDNFGWVYVTESLAPDLDAIVEALKTETGIENWAGAAGMGVAAAGGEYFDESAMAILTGYLPPESYRILPTIDANLAQLDGDIREWLEETGAGLAMIHADCNNKDLASLIIGLAEETSAFLVGGLTLSHTRRHHVAGDVTGGGVSGMLFAPEIAVATGLAQGCTPVGAPHLVSDSVDNVLIGLDGERALDVFKEDVGDLIAADPHRAAGYIHAAFPVPGSDTGDYIVRNLVGIDEERGWLAVAAPVEAGDRVMFVRRDPESARADLTQMVERVVRRAGGTARGAHYVSCIARGPHMFGSQGAEIASVRAALGDIPVIGYFANGEISHDRLYSYTGVLTLFL